ncbi:hypothetical protein HYH02_011724 [Chlamydomonas schloesseri]|uniref:Ubiquitin-like domain-containing protein n=1 Tax=Chlamydomonas schloesseri TaxID=2026947 RepID=A0A835SZ60_9CHLO|nr:hypothetical protein HYH02_011724 [Chlamydomonas schloesseri]|eukprot:KAG2436012.1 hypothetical protein HYH02_011724 [Chlamydomonas schloesseri]
MQAGASQPAPTAVPPAAVAAVAAGLPPSAAASAATAALLLRLLPSAGPHHAPASEVPAAAAPAPLAPGARGSASSGRGEAAAAAAASTPAATATAGAATAVPMRWSRAELDALAGKLDPSCMPAPGTDPTTYEVAFSKYNPTPGTGRTGFLAVPPNNYPFYSDGGGGNNASNASSGGAREGGEGGSGGGAAAAAGGGEKYVPVLQPDGGQLSEWEPMYAPSKEQAEADRAAAYAAGVPHGYVAPGTAPRAAEEDEVLELWVVSELHDDSEYGGCVDAATGRHSGGPFKVTVGAGTRVEQLRLVLRDQGGLLPALQRLSYAGKHLDDSQRTLQHYGIAYWHKRFPHWPIKIRKY